jgi:oxygen-independent coproporphyrinogen-3 oxidase
MGIKMINIILSNIAYEYDVYTLVKAFYPEETIKVIGKDEFHQIEADNNIILEVRSSVKSKEASTVLLREISVDFLEDCIQFTFADTSYKSHIQTLTIDASTPKAQYKNAMKRMLYGMLSETTHRTLPWGILTGIRPTKLVYEMLEEGHQDTEIREKMKEVYLCSEAKLSMSLRIAKREEQLLKEIDYRQGYSLYIGIPFCPSTCLYCSFTSYSIAKYSNYVEAYLVALQKEIEYAATCFLDKRLTTVYFGGGTPTTLTAEQLDYLLGLVKKNFDFTHVKEFCVEAGRPDSITREKLQVLKKWGVDRISINPQSMQQKTLDLIGRKHTVGEIKEAFHLARETGHENINMDIIIGLPGENPEDVADTLKQINELNPDSLTVHTLAIKRAARLNIEKENYSNLKASEVPAMLEQTIEYAEKNDYLPYYLYRQKNMADNLENIGYARYGKEGLYNILIMEEQQTILALGAGGMSKFVFHEENRIERVDNVKSVTDYISRIDEMIARKQQFLQQNDNL